LSAFSFKKGAYYLQLIYYSGKALRTETVGEEQIVKDQKTHNAELFQGCAISNIIALKWIEKKRELVQVFPRWKCVGETWTYQVTSLLTCF